MRTLCARWISVAYAGMQTRNAGDSTESKPATLVKEIRLFRLYDQLIQGEPKRPKISTREFPRRGLARYAFSAGSKLQAIKLFVVATSKRRLYGFVRSNRYMMQCLH